MNNLPSQNSPSHEKDEVLEHAQNFLSATADVAGEAVDAARKGLTAALENAKSMFAQAREEFIREVKITDHAVRKNPYVAIGVMAGVAAVIGIFAKRSK